MLEQTAEGRALLDLSEERRAKAVATRRAEEAAQRAKNLAEWAEHKDDDEIPF
jgi:hypothetical protein